MLSKRSNVTSPNKSERFCWIVISKNQISFRYKKNKQNRIGVLLIFFFWGGHFLLINYSCANFHSSLFLKSKCFHVKRQLLIVIIHHLFELLLLLLQWNCQHCRAFLRLSSELQPAMGSNTAEESLGSRQGALSSSLRFFSSSPLPASLSVP